MPEEIEGGSAAPAGSRLRLPGPAILVSLVILAAAWIGTAQYMFRGRVLRPTHEDAAPYNLFPAQKIILCFRRMVSK